MTGTHDERLRILKMVEEGKLTPEDAARLLEALKETADPASTQAAAASGARRVRWLRIRVTEGDGTRVKVDLPVGLVKAALKVAQRYGGLDETASGEILAALEEAIATGESGRIIEVMDQEDGDRVEIYLE